MEWTENHLIALKAAIATGARRVEYQDKVVEYRSLEDMLRTLAIIQAALGLNKGRASRRYASVSKGTCP